MSKVLQPSGPDRVLKAKLNNCIVTENELGMRMALMVHSQALHRHE